MKKESAPFRFRDIHPSGKVSGATVERLGLGFAPTLSVSSQGIGSSIWYDKYVGVSLDGCYWPRPDIVIRSGTYDLLKSVAYETHVKDKCYSGGYDIRRGRTLSDTTKGWRSLSELVLGDPKLGSCFAELSNNFNVTKELVTLISNETQEVQAFAGHPLEALPSDGGEYARGQVEGDRGLIFWARRIPFLRPDTIIECKSGLLTPHAFEQLSTYREVFPSTPLIVVTTRLPDHNVLRKFRDLEVRCITPPETLRMDFGETLGKTLKEAKENQ